MNVNNMNTCNFLEKFRLLHPAVEPNIARDIRRFFFTFASCALELQFSPPFLHLAREIEDSASSLKKRRGKYFSLSQLNVKRFLRHKCKPSLTCQTQSDQLITHTQCVSACIQKSIHHFQLMTLFLSLLFFYR